MNHVFCESAGVRTPETPAGVSRLMQVKVKNVQFNGFSFQAFRRSIASIRKKRKYRVCAGSTRVSVHAQNIFSSCFIHLYVFVCVDVHACGVLRGGNERENGVLEEENEA